MLEVTHNNQTEPLNKYQGFLMEEEVNGAFTVSFTSFFHENNPGHELIEEESIITVDGYDFRIKQLKESNNRKSVTAISTFYDLVGHRQEEIYGGTRTFNQFATFIFSGTGWTFTSDVTGSALIPNFGTDNVIKLVQGLCQVYECEFKILPNNRIHFAKEIGPDNDAQYRYGHNIKALSKSVDTTNLRTQIRGYGADNLVVTYTSPNVDRFGLIKAEPVHDDRFTISANLIEYIARQLIDYPEVSFELDAVELINKELGERVWLIYELMGIEFQTRVLAKKSTMRNGELVTLSVVLGNTKPKTLSDILTSQRIEIDENKKQVQSRFEQVNDRITMEVEEVGESIAGLEIIVGEVEIYAEQLGESIATINVKTDNISLSVTDLSGRVGSAEAQLNIQAGQISSKVSMTDITGNVITSKINQDPYAVTIDANKINMLGIVDVASTLYIGGRNDTSFKQIRFGGQFGGASISSAQGNNVLTLWAGGGYINMDSPVNISNQVAFNGNSVSGLDDYLRLASHQRGASMNVMGNGNLQLTVNGQTFTYAPI